MRLTCGPRSRCGVKGERSMRTERAFRKEGIRLSALWGRGSKSGSRSSALWGRRGGRAGIAVASLAVALALPVQGFAKSNGLHDGLASALGGKTAYVSGDLLARAKANPNQQFNVIIQGDSWLNSKLVGDT